MKVLKFGATWCSGCLIMKPRWQEIEKENPWLETELYDYDGNQEVFNKYNVSDDLPCFIFLDDNGNEFLRLTVEISKEKILEIIKK